jgi:hypothetical protein
MGGGWVLSAAAIGMIGNYRKLFLTTAIDISRFNIIEIGTGIAIGIELPSAFTLGTATQVLNFFIDY